MAPQLMMDSRDVGRSSKLVNMPTLSAFVRLKARLGLGVQPLCYTIEDMAGDVVELVDTLGIDKFHVIGTDDEATKKKRKGEEGNQI
jgi:pimeloyl-ACP methyl ester carboxylesterase